MKSLLLPVINYFVDKLAIEVVKRLDKRLEVLEEYASVGLRRVSLNCGESGLLIKTAVGYVLCPPTDYQMAACLVDTGDLERGTRILVERLVKPGDVIVDVGANIGLFSLAVAKKMNMEGHIYAFEPFPNTANYAKKNFELNALTSLISLRQVAISDKPGDGCLHLGSFSGHHSLYPLTINDNDEELFVSLSTLDNELSDISHVNLLKIDVEGAELKVLDGATALVERSKDIAIIVEFGASHLKRVGCLPSEWIAKFKSYDFEIRAINDLTGELEEWSLDRMLSVDSVNLFIARKASDVWKRIRT